MAEEIRPPLDQTYDVSRNLCVTQKMNILISGLHTTGQRYKQSLILGNHLSLDYSKSFVEQKW